MTQELEKKVARAISLIRSASKIASANGCPEIEVAYSSGKDSDVILELVKMAGVPYRAIYKSTSIDPAGSIKHAESMGVEVVRPSKTFFELVAENGFPNRFMRFCCKYLKEYKILDYVIIGVRRDESVRRAARYKEPEQCRVYSKNEKVRQYMPILDWSSADVEVFLKERGIRCAPVYYDAAGNFHVERRLGCMCCCLQGRRGRIDSFKQYPNMVKGYIRAGNKYLESHPDGMVAKRFGGDVYAWFVHDVFYLGDKEKWDDLNSGFLPPPKLQRISTELFWYRVQRICLAAYNRHVYCF